MSINICIDIDGTITEGYCWLNPANKYFGTNISEDEVTKYEIHEVLNIDREEYLEFYAKHGKEIHLNSEVRKNAGKVLWNLSRNHNISYVTAREMIMKEVTEKWFHINKLPKEKLYLLGSHYKVAKAKELNCHIFIEDRYENALELSEAGFKVLLVNTNYNRFELNSNITRVYNWDHIYREILKYQLDPITMFNHELNIAVDF